MPGSTRKRTSGTQEPGTVPSFKLEGYQDTGLKPGNKRQALLQEIEKMPGDRHKPRKNMAAIS